MNIHEWCTTNKLDAQINSNICVINEQKFIVLIRKESELIFDSEFDLILTDQEESIISQTGITDVIYEFGNNWYYSSLEKKPELIPFKYIGNNKESLNYPYLGVHGEYELCNGSRLYDDWCKKAKFLDISILGICEKNTLAGTLSFQQSCEKAGIKSILGETVTVKQNDNTYHVKLYAQNLQGWRNLLNINAQIKVFNLGFVEENYILEKSEGLICVFSCTDRIENNRYKAYKKSFPDRLYQQLDFVEWLAPDKEKNHLETLKYNIDNYLHLIKPVIICDAYYLDQSDSDIKPILNTIGKVEFQNSSKDQYFKSTDDIVTQMEPLFGSEDKFDKIFISCFDNLEEIQNSCDFKIKLGEIHLPKYEMTIEEQKQFETNEDLFYHLVAIGLDRIGKSEDEIYLQRVETEIEVIKLGGFIDYFLILWDIINWCEKNDILTGAGRGSAVGSAISYLMNITKLDPIDYGLLFERFLNKGRLGKSLPDVDSDFASNRRDDVKRYMEERYGINYVTSIGTYSTFKIKSGIKDIARALGYDHKKVNYITSLLDDKHDAGLSFTEFFQKISKVNDGKENPIKEFIQNNSEIIENYFLLKDQVKNSSVHAAGVIIVPKEYNGEKLDIYSWLPVKKMDGLLVTEWEGPTLEIAGYLKEDILGTTQLEKLHEITKLIKQNKNIDIDIDHLPLDDQNVFDLFRGGWNEDVFQFGAVGLKGYCKELKPDNIEDLIAAVSLYRPGPMDSGAHKTYIKIKNGEREPEYDYMLEDVAKSTYGLYCYQEQVMQAMNVLGGFNLVEADNIRKAMGKKIASEMEKYKEQFIAGAINNGCEKYNAIGIWNKLEAFAGYGFNRSHAAAYAVTGYACQWLKHHYPLEFWSVALNFSDKDDIPGRISEMHKISEIKVLPPDINKSTDIFEADKETGEIYWSIGSIKFIGEKALAVIMNDRILNGKYFSFDEFYKRIPKKSVNKRCMTNLILSGCFDKIEKIKSAKERFALLETFIKDVCNEELPDDVKDTNNNWKDYFWILKQKELTGFGYLDFEKIYQSYVLPKTDIGNKCQYIPENEFQYDSSVGYNKSVLGTVKEFTERTSKKGDKFAEVVLDCNDEIIFCMVWTQQWSEWKEIISTKKTQIMCISGQVKFDDRFKNQNVLQTTDDSIIYFL